MQRNMIAWYANAALALCVVGVVVALAVAGWSLAQPQKVTSADARHALIGCEAIALFLGGLAWRSPTAVAAMIIAGVLLVTGMML
jgi:hypothetical protein